MNIRQRIIVLVAVLLILITGLYSPWKLVRSSKTSYNVIFNKVITSKEHTVTLRYGWLFAPPHYKERVYDEYGNWRWKITPWNDIEPRLDITRLICSWALIVMVACGLVLVLQDRR